MQKRLSAINKINSKRTEICFPKEEAKGKSKGGRSKQNDKQK